MFSILTRGSCSPNFDQGETSHPQCFCIASCSIHFLYDKRRKGVNVFGVKGIGGWTSALVATSRVPFRYLVDCLAEPIDFCPLQLQLHCMRGK